uniref:Uncharacterized protein n=1 Tax=Meloidogyne enterolobii TaxID=390850 RepID=A0A6V7X1F7_MELEN|nr:unnamed protein product [Meloidogyne enterolobii]
MDRPGSGSGNRENPSPVSTRLLQKNREKGPGNRVPGPGPVPSSIFYHSEYHKISNLKMSTTGNMAFHLMFYLRQ